MQSQHTTPVGDRNADVLLPDDLVPRQGGSRRIQAAWEMSGAAVHNALKAWQESCAALLTAVRRGDATEVARREEVCVDRRRALDAARAHEAAARDRFLSAFLRPARTL